MKLQTMIKGLVTLFILTTFIVLMTSFAFADNQDKVENETKAEFSSDVDQEQVELTEPETNQVTLMDIEDNNQNIEDENGTETSSEEQFEYDIDVSVGKTQTLETGYISVNPEDLLVWESDNLDVAVVDESGALTGVAVGTCTVTARSSLTETEYVFHVTVYDSVKNCTVKLNITSSIYAGKAIKPKVTVLTADGQELDSKQYSITFANNNGIGIAKATVTGNGYYTDSTSKSFTIIPGKSSIAKLTPTNKKITVKYKTIVGGVSYQLQYKKNSSKGWKSVKNGTKLSKVVRGLVNNKKYNFRVRAYKKVNGKTYYGAWSKTKSVLAGIPISKCKIKGIKNKTYNGKKQSQKVKVYYKGKQIKAKITYGNRTKIGRRYVVIHGTGRFAGTVKKSYLIKPGRVKLTDMCSYQWFDDYPKDSEHKYYHDDYNYVRCLDLSCSKTAGNVNYQFAFKCGSSPWEYASYGKSRAVYWYGFKKDKKLRAKVRAYKKVNGEYIFGPWSKVVKDHSKYRDLNSHVFYENKRYITGYVTNVLKGESIKIQFGKRSYTTKIRKNASHYKFKIRVGHHKTGAKYKVYLRNRFGSTIIWDSDNEVYYRKSIKVGMTKYQFRHVYNYWGSPDNISSWSGGWSKWSWDDGSYVYFKNGKIKYWYDY